MTQTNAAKLLAEHRGYISFERVLEFSDDAFDNETKKGLVIWPSQRQAYKAGYATAWRLQDTQINRIAAALEVALRVMHDHSCCPACEPCPGCAIHDAVTDIEKILGEK